MSVFLKEVPKDDKFTVAYARVSTERQAEFGYGLDIQKEKLENYCKLHDIKNAVYFEDDGYSGTNMDRPAIKRSIEYIREGRVEKFIVYRFDRLSRSLRDTIVFIDDELKKNNCDIVSLSEDIDTSNPMGKAMMQITAVFAELDRNNIVTKTKQGMLKRVQSGKWQGGGKVPFGYRYDRDKNTLIVDEKEKEIIKEVFSRYLEGQSPQSISDALGFKSDRIVSQILKRKSLTGKIVYRGETYNGLHEAIIDEDEFLKTQEEIKNRSRFKGQNTHLLSGFLYCGNCGGRMRYQKWGNDGYKLVCYSHYPSSKKYMIKDINCDNMRYDAERVETAVVNEILNLSFELSQNTKSTKVSAENNLSKALEREEKALKKLLSLYKYLDDDKSLLEQIKLSRQNIKRLMSKIEEAKKQKLNTQKLDKTKELIKSVESTWEYMTISDKRQILRELLDKIVLKNGEVQIFLMIDKY